MHNDVAYIWNLFILVCGRVEEKDLCLRPYEAFQGLILHVHIACDQIGKKISGFFIITFVFEIQPILFPHTLLWRNLNNAHNT